MSRQRYLHVFAIVLVLLLLAVTPLAAQEEGPPRTGLRPDAPEYALHGPYWVGTTEMVIDPESERPLILAVWYPALNPERAEESVAYSFPTGVPDISWDIDGHALLNAEPDSSGGPYPLVIWSHGMGSYPYQGKDLSEHLASQGFVVVAPDHPGTDTYAHFVTFEGDLMALDEAADRTASDRIADIQRVIAFTEQLSSDTGKMQGMIDASRTAVTGHSWGGLTALLAGFDSMLVDAIVAEAPADVPNADEVVVPAMVLVGDQDSLVQFAPPIFEKMPLDQKILVVFEGADHMVFGHTCTSLQMAYPGGYWYCSDRVWDMNRIHDLINHFATAFLLAELKGDEAARVALAPDAVSFPGITYEAVGF